MRVVAIDFFVMTLLVFSERLMVGLNISHRTRFIYFAIGFILLSNLLTMSIEISSDIVFITSCITIEF